MGSRPPSNSPSAACATSSCWSGATSAPARPGNRGPWSAATMPTSRKLGSPTKASPSSATGMTRSAPVRQDFRRSGSFRSFHPEHEDRLRQNVADPATHRHRHAYRRPRGDARHRSVPEHQRSDRRRIRARQWLSRIPTPRCTASREQRRTWGSGFSRKRPPPRFEREMAGWPASRRHRERSKQTSWSSRPGPGQTGYCKPLDIDLGLEPVRTQVVLFRWPAELEGRGHRVVIDAINHAWLRPEGANCTLIGAERSVFAADPDTLDESVDAATIPTSRRALVARYPVFANAHHARRLVRNLHAQPRRAPDHRPNPGCARTLGDGRRQWHVVQDIACHRRLPRGVDRRRSASARRSPTIPRSPLRRGFDLGSMPRLTATIGS